MTPPPITTIRARSGSVADKLGSPSRVSVRALHGVEQPVEVGAGELGDRIVVTLHGPFPEIKIHCAGTILDASPQRPAVLRHGALQPGPGELVPRGTAVVGRHQF